MLIHIQYNIFLFTFAKTNKFNRMLCQIQFKLYLFKKYLNERIRHGPVTSFNVLYRNCWQGLLFVFHFFFNYMNHLSLIKGNHVSISGGTNGKYQK